MDANPKQKSNDDVRAFWRDKARLSLLDPHTRWSWYLTLPFISLTGLVTAIAKWETLVKDDAFLFLGLLAILVWPVGLCLELYFKGGDAGASMMREDTSVRRATFKQRCRKLIDDIQSTIAPYRDKKPIHRAPVKKEEIERLHQQIENELKPKLVEQLSQVNDLLQEEGLDPLAINDIKSFRDYSHVEQLIGKVDELLKQLGDVIEDYN